jgi:hypothetical protein
MGDQRHVFRVGGSASKMFLVLSVVAFAMCGPPLYLSLSGKGSHWGQVAAIFTGGLCMIGLYLISTGMLTVSDEGLELQRRLGTQRLRWMEIERARWSGIGGIAAVAVDNWQLWIKGRADGKQITMVLAGAGVERQAEVRTLLAARLPRS